MRASLSLNGQIYKEIRVLTGRFRIGTYPNMNWMGKNKPSKEVLAENLNRLMAANLSLDSNPKLCARAGLGVGTISRLRRGAAAANLDTIDALAECFGVAPWKMVVPDQAPVIEEEAPTALGLQLAWLFDDMVKSLGPREKAQVYAAANEAITRPVTQPGAPPIDRRNPFARAEKPRG